MGGGFEVSDRKDIGQMFGSTGVETFLGIPACPDLQRLEAKAALLGVPVATPYASVGSYCAGAPAAIRAAIAPYAANLHHVDFDLGAPLFPDGVVSAVDCGDLGYDESDFAANRASIREAVATTVRTGAVPVIIGGDDSVPIPMLEALAGTGEYTILQIDAHIDWRDEVDGERYAARARRCSGGQRSVRHLFLVA